MNGLADDTQLVAASELFDADWYRTQYSDVDLTGLEPSTHYLRIGAALMRDPGPGFSTRGYLRSNPDVAVSGDNPLVHYLRCAAKGPLNPTYSAAAEEPMSGRSGVPVRVAVYSHISSIEHWVAVARATAHIPEPFSLYLTAPPDLHAELEVRVHRLYEAAVIIPSSDTPSSVSGLIRLVPRMRADGIDVLCNLPMKDGGVEESSGISFGGVLWDSLVRHLLPSPSGVQQILCAFESKEIGMVGPGWAYKSAHRHMPVKKARLDRVLAMVGAEEPTDDSWGFFAGLGCWVRIPVLRRLTSLALALDGVAEDGFSLDARYAVDWGHAIERVFGLLPRVSRYRTLLIEQQDLARADILLLRQVEEHLLAAAPLKRSLTQELSLQKDVELVAGSGLVDDVFYRSQLRPEEVAIDPSLHYVRHGAARGLDPNREFSTRCYLAYNTALGQGGTNPLVHYLKAGRRLGSLPLSETVDDRGARIFISCWLGNHESIHDGLIELSERLRLDGIRVFFITNATPILNDPRCESINSAFLIHSQRVANSGIAVEAYPDWLSDVARAELKWLQHRSDESRFLDYSALLHGARRSYAFWKDLFTENQPAMVLVWGSTAPISILHLKLCQELSIHTLILERGHFPGTLSVDQLGQFAYGAMNSRPALAKLDPTARSEVGCYFDWIRSRPEVAYARQNLSGNVEALLPVMGQAGRRIVLFIGVNDLGSGTRYEVGDTQERHSLLFSSSRQALERIVAAVPSVDSNAVVVFKPHPTDHEDYRSLFGDDVVLAKDHNINDLIRAADVCISLSTTALARCLVEEKPTISLGLSDVNMKGIVYEITVPGDLPVVLRAALSGEHHQEMVSRSRSFIRHLFEHQLVGVVDDAPTHTNLVDLSHFIEKRVASYTPMCQRRSLGIPPSQRAHFVAGEPLFFKERRHGADWSVPSEYLRPLDVVVPVYGDAEATVACIESVLAAREAEQFRLLLICDASPYSDVVAAINSFAGIEGVVVLHNDRNLGFPGTANRGMAYSRESDVILLNSDTLVPPGWIERLRAHATRGFSVGTVTPMSNNASIFSVRNSPAGYELVNGLEEVTRTDREISLRTTESIETPVGHGFCLLVKRACLDAVGFFDELAFGRGYSEEVDLCLRARSAGFTNVCAPNVFVGHVGGLSFSGTGTGHQRRIEARRVINERYPDYFNEIGEFIARDPLSRYRVNE